VSSQFFEVYAVYVPRARVTALTFDRVFRMLAMVCAVWLLSHNARSQDLDWKVLGKARLTLLFDEAAAAHAPGYLLMDEFVDFLVKCANVGYSAYPYSEKCVVGELDLWTEARLL